MAERSWMRDINAPEVLIAGYVVFLDRTATMPEWTNDIAVARYEYQRSAMHLMPRLEVARLPIVS